MHAPEFDQSVSRRAALAGLAGALAREGSGALAQAATPMPGASPVPRAGHAIVGVWEGAPDQYTALPVAVFEPTGLFLECGVFLDPTTPTVGIGAWRPIDARTVEVVLVDQNLFALEPFFRLDRPLPKNLLAGFAPRIQKKIVVDASGKRATSEQYFVDEQGKDIASTYGVGSIVRLIPSGDLPG
jgi:hypothetical protein